MSKLTKTKYYFVDEFEMPHPSLSTFKADLTFLAINWANAKLGHF